MVQWLGLTAFTAVSPGSVPGQGTKILQAACCGWKRKKKKKLKKMFLNKKTLEIK